MTRARDIADLVDANGDIVAGALDNVPAADLVNDTTPQLGGNLDAQTNDITNAGKVYLNRTTQTKNTDALVVSAPSGGVGGGNSRVDMTVTAEDLTGDGGVNANAFVTTKAKGNYYTGLEVASTSGHVGGWIGHWNGGATSRNLQARVGGTGLNVSDTLGLQINANGYVTKPNQVAFSATPNGGSYVTASPIQFGTVNFNVGNGYNASNYTFTAPIAGTYLFHLHLGIIRLNSSGASGYPRFQVNNANVNYSYVSGPAALYVNANMTMVRVLSANDTVKVVYQGSNSNYYNGASECRFMGYLLG